MLTESYDTSRCNEMLTTSVGTLATASKLRRSAGKYARLRRTETHHK
jgi:hypothetical protein